MMRNEIITEEDSKNQTEKKFQYMTQTAIPSLICQLAVPTIISMLVNTFYNLVDSYFVGKLDTSAAGAIGVAYPLTMILQAIAFFFGHGSGNFISRKLGEKDQEKASNMVSCGVFYTFFIGIIITVVGLIFLKPLVYMLGSTDTIFPYARDYIFYLLLATPFFITSLVINNQLRFQGNALFSMLGIITGAVVNMILDPLLILGFNMGIKGAAIATMAGQILSFFLLLFATTKGGSIRIELRRLNFRFYYFKEIFRGGVPSLFRQGLSAIAAILLNKAAGPIGGDAAITGMSIVSRITMFAGAALIGFGQGFQPVCGFNYGAGLYRRVRKAFYFCVKYSLLLLIVLSAAGWIFADQLVTIFKKEDPEVIRIGVMALRWQCYTFPLFSWNVMTNMMLQSVGRPISASISAAARQGVFFIPLILILPRFFQLTGVVITQPLSDLCAFVISVPLALHFLKELKNRPESTESVQ